MDRNALDLLSNPQIVEIDFSAIDVKEKDYKAIRSFIENCPQAPIIINEDSQKHLGAIYFVLGYKHERGWILKFISKNQEKAIAYYEKAASLGNNVAKYKLYTIEDKKNNLSI